MGQFTQGNKKDDGSGKSVFFISVSLAVKEAGEKIEW